MTSETLPWACMLQESKGCVCFQMKRGMRAMIRAYDDALRPSGLRSTRFPAAWLYSFAKVSSRFAKAMIGVRNS